MRFKRSWNVSGQISIYILLSISMSLSLDLLMRGYRRNWKIFVDLFIPWNLFLKLLHVGLKRKWSFLVYPTTRKSFRLLLYNSIPRIRKFFFHLRRYVNTSEDMICRDGEFDQGFTFDALAKLPQSLQPWIDYHNDVNFHKCFVMNVCDSFNNTGNFKTLTFEFLDIFFSFLFFLSELSLNLLDYIYN